MAIYHFSCKILSRKKGQNSIRSAAYQSGEKIKDDKTGEVYDFRRKKDIGETGILLPDGAPSSWTDRHNLWNVVESVEKRQDAQLCRDFDAALPAELDEETRRRIALDFMRNELIGKGMVVDYAFHTPTGNPHVHFKTTMRKVKNGKFSAKERSWNDKSFLKELRKKWETYVNRELQIAGLEKIDHRSYKDRGLDTLPTIHEGFFARKIERNGGISVRCEHNRLAKKLNQDIISNKKDIQDLAKDRENLDKEMAMVIKRAHNHLSKIGRFGLNNPSHKTVSAISDLLRLAALGNQEAAAIVACHADRAGKDPAKDWQYMTEADRDAEKLRSLYRDDY